MKECYIRNWEYKVETTLLMLLRTIFVREAKVFGKSYPSLLDPGIWTQILLTHIITIVSFIVGRYYIISIYSCKEMSILCVCLIELMNVEIRIIFVKLIFSIIILS